MADVHPETLIAAAGPLLARVAEEKGFTRLAVFGSVARHRAREDSDIDLLVQPPPDTSIGDLLAMRHTFEQILGRPVDLVSYGGLRPDRDDDMTATGKRHDFMIDYEVGFDDEGNILGVDYLYAARCGFSSDLSGPVTDRAPMMKPTASRIATSSASARATATARSISCDRLMRWFGSAWLMTISKAVA